MLPYDYNTRWCELISHCALLQKLEVFHFNAVVPGRIWPYEIEDWASKHAEFYRWRRHDA